MKKLMTMLAMSGFTLSAQATIAPIDLTCVAEAMYAEAQGEVSEGVIGVGNTIVKRVQTWEPRRSPCKHVALGYQRQRIPPLLQGYYLMVARGVLTGEIKDVTNGADSFERKAHSNATRKIGRHHFYIMGSNKDEKHSTQQGRKAGDSVLHYAGIRKECLMHRGICR